MSDMLTEIGRTPERPLRSATVLSVSNGRAKIELATGSVIPDALLVGGVSVGQSVRVAYQGGQYIVYGSAAEAAPSVSVAGTISGGASAGGAPTPHDWLGIHHTLPSGAAGLFAATPSGSSGTVSMRGIVLSDIQAAADSRYSLASRTITAGAGLTGGGDLTTSRTLNIGQGDGIAVDADAVRVRRATTSGLSFSSGGLAVGAGNGISVLTDTVAVNQAYAFTWSAAHTFSANATFSAGLTATRLTGSSNVLELANATSFQSVSFNAGFAGDGWRITRPSGASTKASFETDNLTVRGSMRVYELLINQVRATNGSVLVSSTGKVAAATYVSGTGGAVGVTYDFATDDNTAHGFAANDIIIAKRATGTDPFTAIMRVASTPAPTATTWRGVLLYADGANPSSSTAHIGLEFARIGNTTDINRQGAVYLSADDSGAPFVQVSDGVAAANDWNAAGKVRVKLGNLNGSYGYAANTYGFAAGNSATTFVSADATNGFRVVRNSTTRFQVDSAGNLSVNNSAGTPVISMDTSGNASIAGVLNIGASGEIRQGTGTWSSTFTGTRLWNDSGAGRIAGYNAGVLQWSADSDGKLKTAGGQAVWDSSGLLLNSNQGEFPSGSGFTGSYRFGSWTAAGGWGNTDIAGLKHRYGFRLATTTLYNNDVSAYNVIAIDASAGSTGLIQLKGTDIEAWGTLWFGGGAQDTNLYRLSANNLKTDDTLIVAGGLNVGSATGAATGAIETSGNITATKASNPTLTLSSTASGGGSRTFFKMESQNAGDYFLASYFADASPRRLHWHHNSDGSGSAVPVLSMTAANRVGVNVSTPGYTLDAAGDVNSTGVYRVSGTQVVGTRKTGWAAATGTATRTTFATGTVTTAQLAERVKALVDDLISHGLIGA